MSITYQFYFLYTITTIMQETIQFLDILDSRKRYEANNITTRQNSLSLRRNKFPFAKVLNFSQDMHKEFPKWLTEREDFTNFMYDKYEKKLLWIPHICEKEERSSDQKYFISLYLQQIPIFSKLPQYIMDIILSNIKTKYYKPQQIIHNKDQKMEFMSVVFVGLVQYTQNKKVTKGKNDVILTQAFYGKKHPTVVAKEESVLLTISKDIYPQIQKRIMEDINEKSRDEIADLLKSDFFVELHLKDKKAKLFFENLQPEFYFSGENICQAGEIPEKFYLSFRGSLVEKNHIYVREHNKWPLPNRKWQVRAVYNSFSNAQNLKKFSFFGDEQITNNIKMKSTFAAKSPLILFSMDKDLFIESLSIQDFKRLKKYRNENMNINYDDFEKDVRRKVQSKNEKKKIVHKAINTSFTNRKDLFSKRVSLVEKVQKQMLIKKDQKNMTVS